MIRPLPQKNVSSWFIALGVFAVSIGLAAALPGYGQVSPEDHKKHHPEEGTEKKEDAKSGVPALVKKDGGKPGTEAQEGLRSAAALLSKGLDRLGKAAENEDYLAMQEATAEVRNALAQFESSLAARRALAEGKPPRQVALQWFKAEMNLQPPPGVERRGGISGVSLFHLFTMVLLIAFALAMVAMYFFKMRRAAALFERIEPDSGSPPPGSAPPLAGAPGSPSPGAPPSGKAGPVGGAPPPAAPADKPAAPPTAPSAGDAKPAPPTAPPATDAKAAPPTAPPATDAKAAPPTAPPATDAKAAPPAAPPVAEAKAAPPAAEAKAAPPAAPPDAPPAAVAKAIPPAANGKLVPHTSPPTGNGSAPSGPAAGTSGKWSGKLRLSHIFEETPNVKTFRLMDPLGGEIPFSFQPGQYLSVTVLPEGKPMKRSYTIASSPTEHAYVDLTLKREDKGVESHYLHDRVQVGDLLDFAGPSGSFVYTGNECKCLVFIATGVGITPLMSEIRYLTDRSWPGEIFLLYGCETPRDFIFKKELEYLQSRHPNLHVLVTVTTAASSRWKGPKGQITKASIAKFVPDIALGRVHICGPKEMVKATEKSLGQLGVPKGQVKTESFGPAIGKPAPEPTRARL